MFPNSSIIYTCQESFYDTYHTNCCQKKPLKKPIVLWYIHSPSSFKISKNTFMSKSHFPLHRQSTLTFFICHHYYITTSHILSTSEFHVGSIFHYDSSQSLILYLYQMMWNSLRSTFQWSCPIDSDTSSGIEIRVLQCPGICMNQWQISLLLIMGFINAS